MSYVEGSLGPMLQGVSQQPERLRIKGQVTEQINYDSDVAKGLTSRPGAIEVAPLVGGTSSMTYERINFKNVQYTIGWRANTIEVWTMDGTRLTTTMVQDAGYVDNTDMLFLADESAGHIIVLNRNRGVIMHTNAAPGRPFHAALITCLGGAYFRTYKVTVTVGADTASFEYTTPDGTASAHAEETSSDFIINELKTAFDALTLPAGLTGMTATVSGSTLLLEFTDSMSVTVEDGENGATLRAVTDTAKDVTYLPETAKHGHVVRVQESRSEEDDYYLSFTSDVTTTVGQGFGEPGVWREVATPDEQSAFLLVNMPHKLVIDAGAGTATYARLNWLPRAAGDNVTNPIPKFIGHPIRDITIFEDRLCFIAADSFYTSRTKSTLNLWKKSATVDTDEDPIAIQSTGVSGVQLDWIVPFDRNLLIVSDPGAAQFVVEGGGLTPSNASMVLTTQYDVDSGVRPVGTGKTILLPYKTGGFIGVNEFFTNDVVATNGADPLTISQDRYMPGSLQSMESAQNFSRAAFQVSDQANTVYMYRYLWNGQERIQSAWHKWAFASDVLAFWFDSSYFYVVTKDYVGGTGSVLNRIDMNRVDDDIGYHITLDRRVERTVDANFKVTANFADGLVVQRAGCTDPGLYAEVIEVVSLGGGVWEYELSADMCPVGSTVTVGQPVQRDLEPTMPQPKDFRGEVVSRADLYLSAFYIHMDDSPAVTATMRSPYRPDKSLTPAVFPTEDNSLDPSGLGKQDYVMRMPWGERHDRAQLAITCNDARPDTILEIEYAGDQRRVRRRLA